MTLCRFCHVPVTPEEGFVDVVGFREYAAPGEALIALAKAYVLSASRVVFTPS